MKVFVEKIRADASWSAFLAFAFLTGCSMPLARMALVAALVLSLVDKWKRSNFFLSAPMIGWLAYLAVAVIVSIALWATISDPFLENAKGFAKLSKLLWFAAIPVGIMQVDSGQRLRDTLRAFVAGCAITALAVVFLHPLFAWIQVSFPTADAVARQAALDDSPAAFNSVELVSPFWMSIHDAAESLGVRTAIERWISTPWTPSTFSQALYKLGTMADAQRLMAAVPAALCLFLFELSASKPRKVFRSAAVFFLVVTGLLMTFKRGATIAAFLVCIPLILTRVRWWITTPAVLLCVAVFYFEPHASARFRQLPEEFSVDKGGRALLWTKLVPELHAEYPWGTGFRALTYGKLHQAERTIALSEEISEFRQMIQDIEGQLPAVRESGDRKAIVLLKRRLGRAKERLAAAEFHLQNPPRTKEEFEREIAFGAMGSEELPPMAAPIHLEQNLRHVHSTPLQAFIDFGWIGIVVWAFWMALSFRGIGSLALKTAKLPRDQCATAVYLLAPLAMLAALFIYSLVEYNLADAEVVLIYALAMGSCGAARNLKADPIAETRQP